MKIVGGSSGKHVRTSSATSQFFHSFPVVISSPSQAVSEGLDPSQELQKLSADLAANTANVDTLRRLTHLSIANPAAEAVSPISPEFSYPSSPSPFVTASRSLPTGMVDMWETNRNFERLFNALTQFLEASKVGYVALYVSLLILSSPKKRSNMASFYCGSCLKIRTAILRDVKPISSRCFCK